MGQDFQRSSSHWAVELLIGGSVLQAGESNGFAPVETGKSQKEYDLEWKANISQYRKY